MAAALVATCVSLGAQAAPDLGTLMQRLDAATSDGDRRAAGLALIEFAAIPRQRGDYATATKALDAAIAAADALQDDQLAGTALVSLATVFRLVGDFDRALDTNRRALAAAEAAGDRLTQGRANHNIAVINSDRGHYREALEYYEKALALKEVAGDEPADVALTLGNIGIVHQQQRNFDLALSYYQRGLAVLEKTGVLSQTLAAQTGNVGTVYRETGRLDLARQYFERSLSISERIGNPVGVATQTYNIASVLRRQGKPDEALALYQKSLELREPLKNVYGIRESLHAIANMLADRHRYAEALPVAERDAALARELKSNEALWEPLKTIGDIRHELHDLAGAEAAYRESIDVIETMRLDIAGGAESRRRFFENKLEAYTNLTSTLIEARRPADALAVAERARGRVLFDVLDSADVDVRPLTPAERDRQRALEQDVVLATAERDAEQVRKARLALDEVRDALDARYPVRRLARGDVQPDPIALAASLLPDTGAAILEYVVTDPATYLFVLTRAADGRPLVVDQFTIAVKRSALATQATAFNQKLGSRALEFHAEARALYDLLLKPARTILSGRTKLVIVPDDTLWTVPFDALEPAAGRAVIDGATVAYAPSIAVLHAMHERRASLASKGGVPRLVVAADPASDLPGIPDAIRQASALTTLYGAAQARTFVGAAASEPAIRDASAGATVLHFATHGVVDDANPMYSFLQLARAGKPGGSAGGDARDDGRLEAWEILTLKLDAAVAVLTACDTARGKIGGGEGVIGLAWAFFAAGTPATVVSLWQLDSSSATQLTLAFHRGLHTSLLKGNARVAENLHAAALALRRDPRYRHPFYWAGLVAVGDGF